MSSTKLGLQRPIHTAALGSTTAQRCTCDQTARMKKDKAVRLWGPGPLLGGESVCKDLCLCASAGSVFPGGVRIGKLWPSDKIIYTHLSIQCLAHSGHPIQSAKSLFASEFQWNHCKQDIQGIVPARLLDRRKEGLNPIVPLVLAQSVPRRPLMNACKMKNTAIGFPGYHIIPQALWLKIILRCILQHFYISK